ncbi:MAG: ABC transporter permease subunit [Firmicutes bacterium]|nr:ABC transporter permease subunit [Bacillota bacterium]
MPGSTTSHKWAAIVGIISILLIWQAAAVLINLPLILPSPWATLLQIKNLVMTHNFWAHLGATLRRGVTGFGLSLLLGLGLGLLAGKSELVQAFLRPFVILIRSAPVVSIIILALIWFKRETVPIFVVLLMVFPIIFQNVVEGVRRVDPELLEMVHLYQVRPWLIFTRLTLPSLIPFLAAGISNSLGITWKVLVAAEVLSYPTWGIGAQIDTARVYLQTDLVFAWTVAVIALGLCFDYLTDFLLKKPFKSQKKPYID